MEMSYHLVKRATMLEKYRLKRHPKILYYVLSQTEKLAVFNYQYWLSIRGYLFDAVRDILDEEGITGGWRATYYGYATALWKYLHRFPVSMWPSRVEAMKTMYIKMHKADPRVLDRVTEVSLKIIKEIVGIEEEEENGSKEAGVDNSREAVGEAK